MKTSDHGILTSKDDTKVSCIHEIDIGSLLNAVEMVHETIQGMIVFGRKLLDQIRELLSLDLRVLDAFKKNQRFVHEPDRDKAHLQPRRTPHAYRKSRVDWAACGSSS